MRYEVQRPKRQKSRVQRIYQILIPSVCESGVIRPTIVTRQLKQSRDGARGSYKQFQTYEGWRRKEKPEIDCLR